MAIKTIYITRHGYRSNWLPNGPHPPPPTGVDSDVPLAEHGIKQAKELAHYIASIDNQPELLFSSPFFRCLQTSQPIADMLDLPIYLEKGIGEWYKPDREIIPEPASFEILSNFFLGKLQQDWHSDIIPSNKGETEEEIFLRCKKFWPVFIKKVESKFPDVETILLVTHAATKISLGMTLLGFNNCREFIDDEGSIIRSGVCSLDKYERLENELLGEDTSFHERHWIMTMNGNTEFLIDGEEMHWDFKNGFEAGSDADIAARNNIDTDNLSEDTNSQEFEHAYISVDIPSINYRDKSKIKSTATLQCSGLGTDNPLFKIGNKIYEGTWNKLIGTELAFPNAASLKKKADDFINNDELEDVSDLEQVTQEKIYRITDHVVLDENNEKIRDRIKMMRTDLLKQLTDQYTILLGSKSPRRYDILHNVMGIKDLIVLDPQCSENLNKSDFENPIDYAIQTSKIKADSIIQNVNFTDNLYKPKLIICADTIVIDYQNVIYEKPSSIDIQLTNLKKFHTSEKPLKIVTGVTLIWWKNSNTYTYHQFHDVTEVYFDEGLPLDVIESYVLSNDGINAAGGFKIQGFGGTLIKRINGDYYNVVGLPLNKTFKELYKYLNLNK